MNDIKEYIIKEYPSWKIKALFKISLNELLNDDKYKNIEEKVLDYELFYNIEIEQKIIFNILENLLDLYESKYINIKIKNFLYDYISIFIPSFKIKWVNYKNLNF